MGVEDLFAFYGEGTTTFYSATAETAEDAIKMLRKSVHIPTHNANVFFIMVALEEKCNTKCFEDFPANIGLHEIDCDIYRQIYLIENTMFRGPVTYLGKISHKKKDIEFFNSCVTLYCLVNEGCNITSKEISDSGVS